MKNIPYVNKYLDCRLSRGFVALYTSKAIIMIASGLLGIFMPIFLYNLFGQKFHYVALFNALGYLLYVLAIFFCVRFLNKFGFRRALRVSVFLGAIYYVFFYFIDENNWKLLIPFILLVLTLYRLFYWLPYHVDFAKFTDKKNRARQFSVMNASREILGIFIPLIAGFLISRHGFNLLFIITIIIFLLSGIPLVGIPKTREKYAWSYGKTLKNLLAKENRKEAIAFAAEGAENGIVLIVWPIFIYEILKGNYLEIGALTTFIIAVTAVIQLTLGKKLDLNTPKEKVLKVGSIISSIVWVIKIFVQTTLQVFVIGAFHNLTRIFTITPFTTLTYEISADQGHYVDEYTVFRELCLNISRVFVFIFAAIVSLYFPIAYLFIIAAAAAMLLNLLKPHIKTAIQPGRPEAATRF